MVKIQSLKFYLKILKKNIRLIKRIKIKDFFRKKCLNKLKNTKQKYIKNKLINQILYKFIKKNNLDRILIYIPLDIEANIKWLIYKLKKDKKQLFAPIIKDNKLKVVPYRLPLYKKKFNILEPKNSFKRSKINIAIVPIIGFDSSFRRIGFGKGFYDRFFNSLSYKPLIIFVQIDICFSKKIITEKYDIKANYIIRKDCYGNYKYNYITNCRNNSRLYNKQKIN